MNNKARAEEVANILINIGAVSFHINPPFTFTTGLKSPIYLDNRIILSHPKERARVVDLLVEAIKEHIGLDNVDYISGTATAAIPQASWIAGKLRLPMVYARSKVKDYGKKKKLEGYLKKGSKVLIIEDHISTAQSTIDNALTVREEGGVVRFAISTTTYELESAYKNLDEHNITLHSLTTGRDIVSAAVSRGTIPKDQQKSINTWFDDPEHWSE